jgi:regulator of ribonuclease activity A
MSLTMKAVTDLCDAHPELAAVEPILRDFGGSLAFFGPIVTLKVFEDNSLVRESLEQPGNGRVLVVDGGGSLRCALLGGNLAALAEKNGWAGVIVHGAVRDVRELRAARVGVKAIAPHPRKSEKRGLGERDVPVTFGGVTFKTGEYVYADEDGVVVSPSAIA